MLRRKFLQLSGGAAAIAVIGKLPVGDGDYYPTPDIGLAPILPEGGFVQYDIATESEVKKGIVTDGSEARLLQAGINEVFKFKGYS